MSSTIAALTNGTTVQSTDRIPAARSPYAPGDNVYLTPDELKAYTTSPITIAIGDVATATDLIDGQLYSVTGLSAFTSAVQLTDLRFYAYKDTANIGAVPAVMSSYGIANYSAVGVVRTCEIIIDWYGSGNVEFVNDFLKNEIEGFANINIFPFGSAERKGNKVGSGFTLDITALGSEKFNYNTCYGNGTFTATTGRDYEDIDFTKGYFLTYGNITQSGTGVDPTITVFKNETGGTLTPEYGSTGSYRLNNSYAGFGAGANEVWLHVGNPPLAFSANTAITWITDSRVDFACGQSGTGKDDIFLDTPFEIRVLIS